MNPGNIVDARGRHRAPALRHRSTRRGSRRPCSTSPSRAASRRRSRCATASASAARRSRARCARRTWPRTTRSTRRAAAPTRCAPCSPARLPRPEFTGRRLYEVMDLCLECKGCKAECPSNVDMAKLKYEFLHHYYQANGLPLRNRLFGRIARMNRARAPACRLSSTGSRASRPSRWLLEKVAGIDRRRPLPALAAETFTDWFARRAPPAAAPRGEVVLFHDTFTTYNAPDDRPGRGRACSRRPAIASCSWTASAAAARSSPRGCSPRRASTPPGTSRGWRPYATRGVADRRPRALVPADAARRDRGPRCAPTTRAPSPRQSLPVRGVPRCASARGASTLSFAADGRKALLHGHCHQKALVGTAPTVGALTWAGFEVSEVDSGCCGMAGSFGFEREHYDISVALGNRRLAPAVKAAAAGHRGRRARHLLSPADRAPGRPPREASGRGALREALSR